MVIKKLKTEIKSTKKEPLIKESAFQKRWRLEEEKEAAEKAAAKQKLIDDAKEKKRMESIVVPYLENLYEQLKEKESTKFWIFPDRKGFKKIKKSTTKKLQALIDGDIENYSNRRIVFIEVTPCHNNNFYRNGGVLLQCTASLYNIDAKGKLVADRFTGCTIGWRLEDFKISKFSFKLLEHMIEPVLKKQLVCTAVFGMPLSSFLTKINELKYKVDDLLSPLAGV